MKGNLIPGSVGTYGGNRIEVKQPEIDCIDISSGEILALGGKAIG